MTAARPVVLARPIDGLSMGYGTWRLAPDEAEACVRVALDAGFRHVDTAAAYLNEAAVGRGIAAWIADRGIHRDEVFVSGKLWKTKRRREQAMRACKQSLRRMGLEYFDLYLIHWPASPRLDDDWQCINDETWGALESLRDEGVVREIGVSNFLPVHLTPLVEHARIIPRVDQVELHPGKLQGEVLSFCASRGIGVEAWSPLGHGEALGNPVVREVAAERGATPAQVCLAWCLAHGATPITATRNGEHLRESLAATELRLSVDEMSRIDAAGSFAESGMHPDRDNEFR